MSITVKPFLKWAGGKTQLLGEIEKLYQLDGVNKYVEPFIGGGAVFFDILNKHMILIVSLNNIKRVKAGRMINSKGTARGKICVRMKRKAINMTFPILKTLLRKKIL